MLKYRWLATTMTAMALVVTPMSTAQADDMPRGAHYGVWAEPMDIDVHVPERLGPGWRLGKAMKAWNASGVVNLHRNPNPAEADIVVTLEPTSASAIQDWAGLAWLDVWEGGSVDGYISNVDVWLNQDLPRWALETRHRVMVHELGHALGLDHSSKTDSVMSDAATLTTTDILELQELYMVGADAAGQTGVRR